jgi:hypothetical protein
VVCPGSGIITLISEARLAKGVFIHDSVKFLKDLTGDSMATHIVSWGGNDHTVSPVVSSTSSTSSIISIDPIIRHKRSAVQGTPASESSTKCMSSLSLEPSGNETSTSGRAYSTRADSTDDSFIRHHKYFFKDGNVTFLVRES